MFFESLVVDFCAKKSSIFLVFFSFFFFNFILIVCKSHACIVLHSFFLSHSSHENSFPNNQIILLAWAKLSALISWIAERMRKRERGANKNTLFFYRDSTHGQNKEIKWLTSNHQQEPNTCKNKPDTLTRSHIANSMCTHKHMSKVYGLNFIRC